MPAYIRGPSVSYNGLQANPDLFNAIGFIDFTLPDDWDNTDSADRLTVAIIAGIVADGAVPTDIGVSFHMELRSVNGGSWLEAGTNTSGESLPIGSVLNFLAALQSSNTLDTIGLGQDAGEFNAFAGTDVTGPNVTLADATDAGYPAYAGDAFGKNYFVTGPPEWNGPVGWYPNVASDHGETPAVVFNPGDTVTLAFVMDTDVEDTVNPDRSVYGVIQSINMNYKATSYPLDLTAFKVGFGPGGSWVPVISDVVGPNPVYANARKDIDATVSPTDHPNARVYIDLYLTATPAAGQTTQGMIF